MFLRLAHQCGAAPPSRTRRCGVARGVPTPVEASPSTGRGRSSLARSAPSLSLSLSSSPPPHAIGTAGRAATAAPARHAARLLLPLPNRLAEQSRFDSLGNPFNLHFPNVLNVNI
uniref:Uncharacterized protein n=1 Tax=Oryza sativa subsp. japonica TaxID=39947 RepID=Q5VP56_ORYSJ|nr:hypothetical protein [Oryza sativa Japonica Group]BAD68769.1 hypothetical protein [Oryza sativa Japonica Group]